ncbi:MAG TPA: PorP/SprF family type IX secretion system membrane protein [Chitinophagales bacterium]|nr:PorP/SprF family type IX secretion system membrane protein [Chitinophagales bacterium]
MNGRAIILFLFSWQSAAHAQDLEFSQFFNAPLYLNPALAGVDIGPRFALNYRNEWAGLGNAYISYAASYDQHFDALNGAIGVLVVSDQQANGIYVGNSVTGIYSYQINFSKKFALQGAASVALVQKRIQSDKLIFAENINPNDGSIISSGSVDLPDRSSRTFPDFGAGFLFFTPKTFFGFSVKHLTSPNESLLSTQTSPLTFRIAGNFGVEFHSKSTKKTPVFFSPNIFLASQAKFKQLTAGAILGIGLFYGGFSYRTTFTNGDATILMAGLQKGVFKFGYSFDATVSGLKGSTSGSHELSLVLNFHDSEKVQKKLHTKKASQCPPRVF